MTKRFSHRENNLAYRHRCGLPHVIFRLGGYLQAKRGAVFQPIDADKWQVIYRRFSAVKDWVQFRFVNGRDGN